MVCSSKVAFILSLVVAFTLVSSSEDNERVNLDHETVIEMLNETIQHWQVSAEETAEMKEILRRREEMHRKSEEEDIDDRQLREELGQLGQELGQLRQELRQLKEEGMEYQLQSTISTLSIQSLLTEIQHEQQKQPAVLNVSLERFMQQHQIDLRALKTIITEQGLDMDHLLDSLATINDSISSHSLDMDRLQDSLATINDSISSHSDVEASEKLLQQCRNESQATSDALTTQQETYLGILNCVASRMNPCLWSHHHKGGDCRRQSTRAVLPGHTITGDVEASEQLLQQCRNESQAASDALTTQQETYLGILKNDKLSFSHDGRSFYFNNNSKLTWDEARTWCQALGGDLAHPSYDLTGFLQEIFSRKSSWGHVWLGASDEQLEGQWMWVSGTDLPAGFPWGENEPNNHNGLENCLDVHYRNKKPVYNDSNCSGKSNFVCELGPAQ